MLEVKVRQPKCTFCPYHHRHAEACGTKLKVVYLRPFSRYCTGGKRPRVFKPKDPKEKVPAWCPRKITPCAARVYHYKNPDTELLQSLLRQRGMEPYVSATDYAVCYESHTDISAEEFQNEVCFLNLSDRLGFPLHPWEVLEIDDGLYPYFFYLDDKLRLHCIHFRKEDCGRNTLTGFSATEVAQWRE